MLSEPIFFFEFEFWLGLILWYFKEFNLKQFEVIWCLIFVLAIYKYLLLIQHNIEDENTSRHKLFITGEAISGVEDEEKETVSERRVRLAAGDGINPVIRGKEN